MKKLVLALTAVAALTGSANAADLGARPYSKAPPPLAPVYSWTGCYIDAGGGYGWYNAESREVDPVTGAFLTHQGTAGGRGWMGQVGAGCDYQFAGPLGNWVIGAFGDYTFSDVHGDKIGPPDTLSVGNLKQDWSWAAGGRLGYVVSPTFLTYFSAGYTETHFKQVDYVSVFAPGVLTGTALPASTYQGWFIGTGFEYSLSFLPGLFLKTEARYSQFDRKQLNNFFTGTGVLTGTAETVKPFSESVITTLVYRFNWGGPVVARY